MWMEEHVDEGYDRVNIIRSKELAATGADTVAVGCPFCSTMVTDGLSSIGSEMEVKDIVRRLEQIMPNDAKIELQSEAGISVGSISICRYNRGPRHLRFRHRV